MQHSSQTNEDIHKRSRERSHNRAVCSQIWRQVQRAGDRAEGVEDGSKAVNPVALLGDEVLAEGVSKHKKKITDKSIPIRDTYSREQEYRKKKNSTVKFNINDDVNHPKFGKGTIEHIEQLEGSVRLHVRFGEDLKKIDQKWLLQAGMKKAGAPRHI